MAKNSRPNGTVIARTNAATIDPSSSARHLSSGRVSTQSTQNAVIHRPTVVIARAWSGSAIPRRTAADAIVVAAAIRPVGAA